MAAIDHETNFDKIINSRLRSDDWNMTIARRLIEKRRRKKYKIFAAGLAAALGFTVLILSSIMPLSRNLSSISEGEELSNFIQAQVDGTWKKNAGGTIRIDKKEIFIVGAQFDASLDEMIEEALSERF